MYNKQVEDLARRLVESEAALQALTAGQVDAVVDPVSGAYFMLRQAQEALRRAHDDLEMRVRERTAELEQAHAALRTEIAERQRAQATWRLDADRLQISHEMDQAILAARSANEIAGIGLAHLERLLSCQWASVAMFDWQTGEAEVLASQIDGEARPGKGWRGPLTYSLLDLVSQLREGQVWAVEDIGPLAPAHVAEGSRACTVVPLHAQGELIGTLNLAAAGTDPLDRERMALLWEAANRLAVGLRLVCLYDQVQRCAFTPE